MTLAVKVALNPNTTNEPTFSHCVFKRFAPLTRKNQGLFGKGLITDNPFPDKKILNSSKMKEFADGNYKSDEHSRKFGNRIENTVGKVEIAHYE